MFVMMLPAQMSVGFCSSVTVTVNVQFEVLPLASVAVHTTLLVPLTKLVPEAGTHNTEPPGQLSVNENGNVTLVAHSPGAVLTDVGRASCRERGAVGGGAVCVD